MISKENNFAYIDGANLDKGVKELGWELDYNRFRVMLKERYGVSNAYLLRKQNIPLLYLNTQKGKLESRIVKEKAPNRDGTP